MQCLVTAGPTYEPLDEVRRLTNFSTGALGCGLAAALTAAGHDTTLLLGHYATAAPPEAPCIRFTTTQDLHQRLEQSAGPNIGAVFHAAAVSDFGFGQVFTRQPGGQLAPVCGAKLTTRGPPLLAELVPTPKILPRLRAWFPRALIVGWKYELEGGTDEALARAQRQLSECASDLCVVNGRAYGPGFGVVRSGGLLQHCAAASALYAALLEAAARHSA